MIDTGISQFRLIQHSDSKIAIHRVYTNEHGEVIDYEREPAVASSDSVQTLTHQLVFMLNALVLPVIHINDLKVDNNVVDSVQSALDLFKPKE